MKKLSVWVLVLVALLSACGKPTRLMLKAGGREGEIMIVMDNEYANGPVEDTLRAFFEGPFPGVPQVEPLFKVYRIFPQDFKNGFKRTNNVLLVNIDPKLIGKEPTLTYGKDNWALGQVVLQLNCGNEVEFFKVFRDKKSRIFDIIRSADMERLQERNRETQSMVMLDEMKKALGLSLVIPEGYYTNIKDTNFYYAMNDATKMAGGLEHQITRAVWATSFKISDPDFFNVKYLSHIRDSVAQKYMKGSTDTSYMIIEPKYVPDSSAVNLNGEYCMEMRGLWRMNDRFMGGPFINYTFIDKKNKRAVMVEGWVFAPRFDKRPYMLEMESICRSVEVVN